MIRKMESGLSELFMQYSPKSKIYWFGSWRGGKVTHGAAAMSERAALEYCSELTWPTMDEESAKKLIDWAERAPGDWVAARWRRNRWDVDWRGNSEPPPRKTLFDTLEKSDRATFFIVNQLEGHDPNGETIYDWWINGARGLPALDLGTSVDDEFVRACEKFGVDRAVAWSAIEIAHEHNGQDVTGRLVRGKWIVELDDGPKPTLFDTLEKAVFGDGDEVRLSRAIGELPAGTSAWIVRAEPDRDLYWLVIPDFSPGFQIQVSGSEIKPKPTLFDTLEKMDQLPRIGDRVKLNYELEFLRFEGEAHEEYFIVREGATGTVVEIDTDIPGLPSASVRFDGVSYAMPFSETWVNTDYLDKATPSLFDTMEKGADNISYRRPVYAAHFPENGYYVIRIGDFAGARVEVHDLAAALRKLGVPRNVASDIEAEATANPGTAISSWPQPRAKPLAWAVQNTRHSGWRSVPVATSLFDTLEKSVDSWGIQIKLELHEENYLLATYEREGAPRNATELDVVSLRATLRARGVPNAAAEKAIALANEFISWWIDLDRTPGKWVVSRYPMEPKWEFPDGTALFDTLEKAADPTEINWYMDLLSSGKYAISRYSNRSRQFQSQNITDPVEEMMRRDMPRRVAERMRALVDEKSERLRGDAGWWVGASLNQDRSWSVWHHSGVVETIRLDTLFDTLEKAAFSVGDEVRLTRSSLLHDERGHLRLFNAGRVGVVAELAPGPPFDQFWVQFAPDDYGESHRVVVHEAKLERVRRENALFDTLEKMDELPDIGEVVELTKEYTFFWAASKTGGIVIAPGTFGKVVDTQDDEDEESAGLGDVSVVFSGVDYSGPDSQTWVDHEDLRRRNLLFDTLEKREADGTIDYEKVTRVQIWREGGAPRVTVWDYFDAVRCSSRADTDEEALAACGEVVGVEALSAMLALAKSTEGEEYEFIKPDGPSGAWWETDSEMTPSRPLRMRNLFDTLEKSDAITPDMEGVWLDGARGQYTCEAIIEEAIARGWDHSGWDAADEEADGENYHEMCEAAEDFMNTLAPEGYYFGTSEGGGDWGLWKNEDDHYGDMEQAPPNLFDRLEKGRQIRYFTLQRLDYENANQEALYDWSFRVDRDGVTVADGTGTEEDVATAFYEWGIPDAPFAVAVNLAASNIDEPVFGSSDARGMWTVDLSEQPPNLFDTLEKAEQFKPGDRVAVSSGAQLLPEGAHAYGPPIPEGRNGVIVESGGRSSYVSDSAIGHLRVRYFLVHLDGDRDGRNVWVEEPNLLGARNLFDRLEKQIRDVTIWWNKDDEFVLQFGYEIGIEHDDREAMRRRLLALGMPEHFVDQMLDEAKSRGGTGVWAHYGFNGWEGNTWYRPKDKRTLFDRLEKASIHVSDEVVLSGDYLASPCMAVGAPIWLPAGMRGVVTVIYRESGSEYGVACVEFERSNGSIQHFEIPVSLLAHKEPNLFDRLEKADLTVGDRVELHTGTGVGLRRWHQNTPRDVPDGTAGTIERIISSALMYWYTIDFDGIGRANIEGSFLRRLPGPTELFDRLEKSNDGVDHFHATWVSDQEWYEVSADDKDGNEVWHDYTRDLADFFRDVIPFSVVNVLEDVAAIAPGVEFKIEHSGTAWYIENPDTNEFRKIEDPHAPPSLFDALEKVSTGANAIRIHRRNDGEFFWSLRFDHSAGSQWDAGRSFDQEVVYAAFFNAGIPDDVTEESVDRAVLNEGEQVWAERIGGVWRHYKNPEPPSLFDRLEKTSAEYAVHRATLWRLRDRGEDRYSVALEPGGAQPSAPRAEMKNILLGLGMTNHFAEAMINEANDRYPTGASARYGFDGWEAPHWYRPEKPQSLFDRLEKVDAPGEWPEEFEKRHWRVIYLVPDVPPKGKMTVPTYLIVGATHGQRQEVLEATDQKSAERWLTELGVQADVAIKAIERVTEHPGVEVAIYRDSQTHDWLLFGHDRWAEEIRSNTGLFDDLEKGARRPFTNGTRVIVPTGATIRLTEVGDVRTRDGYSGQIQPDRDGHWRRTEEEFTGDPGKNVYYHVDPDPRSSEYRLSQRQIDEDSLQGFYPETYFPGWVEGGELIISGDEPPDLFDRLEKSDGLEAYDGWEEVRIFHGELLPSWALSSSDPAELFYLEDDFGGGGQARRNADDAVAWILEFSRVPTEVAVVFVQVMRTHPDNYVQARFHKEGGKRFVTINYGEDRDGEEFWRSGETLFDRLEKAVDFMADRVFVHMRLTSDTPTGEYWSYTAITRPGAGDEDWAAGGQWTREPIEARIIELGVSKAITRRLLDLAEKFGRKVGINQNSGEVKATRGKSSWTIFTPDGETQGIGDAGSLFDTLEKRNFKPGDKVFADYHSFVYVNMSDEWVDNLESFEGEVVEDASRGYRRKAAELPGTGAFSDGQREVVFVLVAPHGEGPSSGMSVWVPERSLRLADREMGLFDRLEKSEFHIGDRVRFTGDFGSAGMLVRGTEGIVREVGRETVFIDIEGLGFGLWVLKDRVEEVPPLLFDVLEKEEVIA